MLKKLMKYEWKATKRIFFPLYGAMLIVAFVNGIFFRFDNMTENGIAFGVKALMIFAYVAIIIATFVMTAVVMIQRYYKNILGREGYLMNTLPVKATSLIWSKAIISTIWYVGSTLVVMISIPVIILVTNPTVFQEFFGIIFSNEVWKEMVSDIRNINLIFWMLELLVLGIASCFAFCMKVYAAMSLGHLIPKSRMIASVGFFIAIDFGERMIVLIVTSIFSFLFRSGLETWISNNHFIYSGDGIMGVHIFLIGSILYTGITMFVYFLISKNILEKKLNLE